MTSRSHAFRVRGSRSSRSSESKHFERAPTSFYLILSRGIASELVAFDMPPGAAKRTYPPFKPPRPRNSADKTPTTASAAKSKPKASASASKSSTSNRKQPRRQKSPSVDPEEEGSDDNEETGSQAPSSPHSISSFEEPDYILAEITEPAADSGNREAIDSADPAIPPKLLTRLLHHHFQSDKTKVAKDANRVVAKYVDIFVREALARAAYERQEGSKQADAAGGRRGLTDGFLEVCWTSRSPFRWTLLTMMHYIRMVC